MAIVPSSFFLAIYLHVKSDFCLRKKILTLAQTNPGLNVSGEKSLAHNKQFHLFQHCFLLFGKTFH